MRESQQQNDKSDSVRVWLYERDSDLVVVFYLKNKLQHQLQIVQEYKMWKVLARQKKRTIVLLSSEKLLIELFCYHHSCSMIHPYLVGGFNPSEKYWSVVNLIPNIWKNIIHVPNHQPDMEFPYLLN